MHGGHSMHELVSWKSAMRKKPVVIKHIALAKAAGQRPCVNLPILSWPRECIEALLPIAEITVLFA